MLLQEMRAKPIISTQPEELVSLLEQYDSLGLQHVKNAARFLEEHSKKPIPEHISESVSGDTLELFDVVKTREDYALLITSEDTITPIREQLDAWANITQTDLTAVYKDLDETGVRDQQRELLGQIVERTTLQKLDERVAGKVLAREPVHPVLEGSIINEAKGLVADSTRASLLNFLDEHHNAQTEEAESEIIGRLATFLGEDSPLESERLAEIVNGSIADLDEVSEVLEKALEIQEQLFPDMDETEMSHEDALETIGMLSALVEQGTITEEQMTQDINSDPIMKAIVKDWAKFIELEGSDTSLEPAYEALQETNDELRVLLSEQAQELQKAYSRINELESLAYETEITQNQSGKGFLAWLGFKNWNSKQQEDLAPEDMTVSVNHGLDPNDRDSVVSYMEKFVDPAVKVLVSQMERVDAVTIRGDGTKTFISGAIAWNVKSNGSTMLTRTDGTQITPENVTGNEMKAIEEIVSRVEQKYGLSQTQSQIHPMSQTPKTVQKL